MTLQPYLATDTIHALATPTGGALSVVRISGPRSRELLTLLTGGDLGTPARELFRAKLRDGNGETLDDGMATYFVAPKSHTGEDGAELFLHGGSVVAGRVLEALTRLGSRQALPGEFSFRAVRNGKSTVAEAEAVADLIAARNEDAARLALEKMGGSQAKWVGELAESMRKLATMSELGIDFADQDVEELSLPTLKRRLAEIREGLSRLESSFERGKHIQEGIPVAFVGRPNAGKSSFFNALLGEERSIVSDIAGTTRDVVRESLTLRASRAASVSGSVTLRLHDTAGVRAQTGDRIEREGIERSLRAGREAEFVLLISDAGLGANEAEETETVWRSLGIAPDRAVLIFTKKDLVNSAGKALAMELQKKLGIRDAYWISSVDADGVQEAADGIVQFCERFVHRAPGEVLLTRLDHLAAVRATQIHLERAMETTEEDLFAADLRQALISIGPVIGQTLPDDILGRIFSEFCIGK